jgi:hypothetical protein
MVLLIHSLIAVRSAPHRSARFASAGRETPWTHLAKSFEFVRILELFLLNAQAQHGQATALLRHSMPPLPQSLPALASARRAPHGSITAGRVLLIFSQRRSSEGASRGFRADPATLATVGCAQSRAAHLWPTTTDNSVKCPTD